jgi:predicted TIM-barrel fold metal-dependent hydrolase
MWGSDFPHSVGTHPHSRQFIEELFEDVPERERHQVLVDNVCDFFGLDPEKELTPTPG